MPFDPAELSRKDVEKAAILLLHKVHKTPVFTSKTLSGLTNGCTLYFKDEALQKVGAFKFRGALHAISKLSPEEMQRGVCTHSSGNHAQALACAAQQKGIRCWIVMPEDASSVKLEATRGYGATIVLSPAGAAAREAKLKEVVAETNAVFIPPYDHPDVICGQGTAMLEFLEDVPSLNCVLAPVGGGGLLAGCALAAIGTGVTVYGAEPALVDDAHRGFHSGTRVESVPVTSTVADGLKTPVGKTNFEIIRNHVADIFTVTEEQIMSAFFLVLERMKLVVEPSAVVPLAVALYNPEFRAKAHGNVGIIFSGGNVDLKKVFQSA